MWEETIDIQIPLALGCRQERLGDEGGSAGAFHTELARWKG